MARSCYGVGNRVEERAITVAAQNPSVAGTRCSARAIGRVRKNQMTVGILLLMLSAQLLVQAADSPIAPGSKPRNEGAIGAGEGPAWHPEEGLYFTGRNRITRRDRSGNVAVFREPAGGANGLL